MKKTRFFIMVICSICLLNSAESTARFMTIAWEAPTARQDGTPLDENEILRYIILGERLFDNKKFYFATEETYFLAPRPRQAFLIKVLCQDINNNMGMWSEGIYYYP